MYRLIKTTCVSLPSNDIGFQRFRTRATRAFSLHCKSQSTKSLINIHSLQSVLAIAHDYVNCSPPGCQGWTDYAGTHVPMFFQTWLNEARTNKGLSPTMGFLNENASLAYFAILGELSSGPCFTVGFFKTESFLSLSVGFSGGKERRTFFATP